jgi:hypothetical protein
LAPRAAAGALGHRKQVPLTILPEAGAGG